MGEKWLNQAIRGRNRSSPPTRSKQRRPSPRDASPAWDHPPERRRLVRSPWRPGAMEGPYDEEDEEVTDSSEDDDDEEDEGCWVHCCGECMRWHRVFAALLAFAIITALLYSIFSAAEILPPALSFAMSAPEQTASSQPITEPGISAPDSLALGTMFPALSADADAAQQQQQQQPQPQPQQLQAHLLHQQLQEQLQRLQEQQQQLLHHFEQQQALRPAPGLIGGTEFPQPQAQQQLQQLQLQAVESTVGAGRDITQTGASAAASTAAAAAAAVTQLQPHSLAQPLPADAEQSAVSAVDPLRAASQPTAQLPARQAGAGAEFQPQAAVAAPARQSARPTPRAEIVSLLDARAARTASRLGGHALGGCGKTIPLSAEGAPGGGQHRKVTLDDCNPAPAAASASDSASAALADVPVEVAFDDSAELAQQAEAEEEQQRQQQAAQEEEQQQRLGQVRQESPDSEPVATAGTAEAVVTRLLAQPAGAREGDPAAAAATAASSSSTHPSSTAESVRATHAALSSLQADLSGVGPLGHAASEAADLRAIRGSPSHKQQQQLQGSSANRQRQQPQQLQNAQQVRGKQGRQGGEQGDNMMATAFRACIDHTRVQRMAEHSGWPYLLVKGEHVGFTRQQEVLLRALWLAKATGAVLVLPPFFKSFPAHPALEASLEQFFNTHYLITHMYCSSEVWVVQSLPPSIQEQLPAGYTPRHVDVLLSAPNSTALSIPGDIVAGTDDINHPGLLRWLETVRQQTASGKVRLLVYDSDLPLALSSPDQQRFKKNGLAALRPSVDVSAVITQLLHRLRKAFQDRLGGDLSKFRFAALHIGADTSSGAGGLGGGGVGSNSSSGSSGVDGSLGGTEYSDARDGGDAADGGDGGGGEGNSLVAIREALLANVDPSQMLLYVTVGRSEEHATVLQELKGAYQVVTKEMLIPNIGRRFPSREMQAAFEQGVAKEASLFLAPSTSAFSGFVFQSRCFTRPTLGQKPLRDTVFYDKGIGIAVCHVRPTG